MAKLILAATEANNYAKYLAGFASSMTGGTQVWLALGTLEGTTFTELTPNDANNYARVLVKRTNDAIPDLLTVSERTMYNHEQIVFNKVLSEAYTAPAIALYRQETGGTPYAFGDLDTPLTATVGSLPMFERNAIRFTVPVGTE